MNQESIGTVLESSPNSIIIEIKDQTIFETQKINLQIGKYVEISDGNHNKVVAIIQNIKSLIVDNSQKLRFIIATQPIGYLDDQTFIRGASLIPSPTEPVFIIAQETMNHIFHSNVDFNFQFGKLVQNKKIDLYIDANKFFSKHIALVGSTGSGKSCTVSKIIQDVVGIENSKNSHNNAQKNAHVIIFDIHAEYEAAFKLNNDENFTLNKLDVDTLKLPYWLMNSRRIRINFYRK